MADFLVTGSTTGVHSFRVAAGVLTYLHSERSSLLVKDIWSDGTFIYAACGVDGLRTFSIDGGGNLTLLDVEDTYCIDGNGVWGDGTYIYVAGGTAGIQSFTVDAAGLITWVDDQDDAGNAEKVWGDGTYIYLANGDTGIASYSQIAGIMSQENTNDRGDYAWSLASDGTFIFLANDAGGLCTFTVAAGVFTYKNVHDPGDVSYGVCCADGIIYCANGAGGLFSYTVDVNGALTNVDSDYQDGTYYDCFALASYVYVNCGAGGVKVYSDDGIGNLTYEGAHTYKMGTAQGKPILDAMTVPDLVFNSAEQQNTQIFDAAGNSHWRGAVKITYSVGDLA